jgi:predicted MPP superfamily phosphohydrolase
MNRSSSSRDFPLRRRLQRALSSREHRRGEDHFQPGDFKVEKLTIEMRNLDAAFEGYRIVHLTDLHVGQWLSVERLAGVVDLVNQQEPDLILMTGDYVSYEIENISEDMVSSLRAMRAGDGKIAVLGNHDHWVGTDQIIHLLYEGGFTVLSNRVFVVHKELSFLQIAGVDSVMLQKDDLDAVLELLSPDAPAILLVHEPNFADVSARSGRFDLQLSGHSHGGQIVLPIIGSLLRGPHFWKYPIGLYRFSRPDTTLSHTASEKRSANMRPVTAQALGDPGEMLLYTNRGLGTNTLRFRHNCPPEILLITLKAGHK